VPGVVLSELPHPNSIPTPKLVTAIPVINLRRSARSMVTS